MANLLFNGTVDLGPLLEGVRAFKHFGHLSHTSKYGMLHGALHAALAESTEIPQDDLGAVSYQAGAFMDEFSSELSDHERYILGQLKSCNHAEGQR